MILPAITILRIQIPATVADGTEDDTEFDYPTEEETFPSDYADTGDYTGTDVYTDNNWQ